LFDTITTVLEGTVEYKEYLQNGWNAATISAAFMVLFTFPEIWGIRAQAKTIERERNGDSVSNVMFMYGLSFFFVCAVFGLHNKSAAMVFNAVLTGLPQVFVLAALLKYKGFSRTEYILAGIFTCMPVWEYYTPYKSESYLVMSFGFWYAFGAQLKELWSAGKTGALDIRLMSVYLGASSAWTVFVFQGNDLYFKISQIGVITLITAIFCLWWIWWWRERRLRLRAHPTT